MGDHQRWHFNFNIKLIMFRHRGKSRTVQQNKRIASLLSFVAGVVNVAGFLSVHQLTTNVTGHFAFFTEEVFRLNFSAAAVFLLFVLCFFGGSFVSNFLIEVIRKTNDRYTYTVPVMLETAVLVMVAVFGSALQQHQPAVIACFLLFAMGLQNSMVTIISNAIVRTTHLTGLFTDLGIELSQLFFYKSAQEKRKLWSTIFLRLRIIRFFFFGALCGGLLYGKMQLYILFLPAALLVGGLFYDVVRFKMMKMAGRKKD